MRAQIEFQIPCRAWLLAMVPIVLRSCIGVDKCLLRSLGPTLICSKRADLPIDDNVRDMNATPMHPTQLSVVISGAVRTGTFGLDAPWRLLAGDNYR